MRVFFFFFFFFFFSNVPLTAAATSTPARPAQASAIPRRRRDAFNQARASPAAVAPLRF